MHKETIRAEKAVIIIHEIYGINQYIKEWATFFSAHGFDVYCLDLIGNNRLFSYSEQGEAYAYFKEKIGFDRCEEVAVYIKVLKKNYSQIIIFGSSVGATIAWRLTENSCCDGMIGYYGSRIREYLKINPSCPCLLLFAENEESFNVKTICQQLMSKDLIEVAVLTGKHGFADPYGNNYYHESCKKARDMVECFLNKIEKGAK